MPTAYLEYHEYDGDKTVVTYRTYYYRAGDHKGRSDASGSVVHEILGFRAIAYAYRVWIEDDDGNVINIYKDRDLSFDPKKLTKKERFLLKLRSKPLDRSIQ
jgi:hypothetical protein